MAPDDAEAHFGLGRSRYNQLDKLPAAEAALVDTLIRDPEHEGAYAHLRAAYLNRGLYVQMIAALDRVLATHPAAVTARMWRAVTLRDRGDLDEARRAFEALLADAPDAHLVRVRLAHLLAVDLKRTDEALPHLRRVLEGEAVAEEITEAATTMISVIIQGAITRGEHESALVALDVWKLADPENGLVWANRGTVLRRLGRYAEAARSYESARVLRPFDPSVPNDLALVRLAEGKTEAVKALFREALEIDPDHLDALENLGILARVEGDLEAARRAFRHAFDVAVARDLPDRSRYRRYLDLVSPLGR